VTSSPKIVLYLVSKTAAAKGAVPLFWIKKSHVVAVILAFSSKEEIFGSGDPEF
jgi:hypothetical protein